MQIRDSLEPFDWEPSTPFDKVVRVSRPMLTQDNGAEYEGEWDNMDRKDGKGVQIWVDGSIYEGYWCADKANGRGRLIWADGSYYTGEFLEDNLHGEGVYKWSDGRQYDG